MIVANIYRITEEKTIKRIFEEPYYEGENNTVLRFFFSAQIKARFDVINFYYQNNKANIIIKDISKSLTAYRDEYYVEQVCPAGLLKEGKNNQIWLEFLNAQTQEVMKIQPITINIQDAPDIDDDVIDEDLPILKQLILKVNAIEQDVSKALIIDEEGLNEQI